MGSRYPEFRIMRPQLFRFVNRTNFILNLGGLVIRKNQGQSSIFRILRPKTGVSLTGQITDNETLFLAHIRVLHVEPYLCTCGKKGMYIHKGLVIQTKSEKRVIFYFVVGVSLSGQIKVNPDKFRVKRPLVWVWLSGTG